VKYNFLFVCLANFKAIMPKIIYENLLKDKRILGMNSVKPLSK